MHLWGFLLLLTPAVPAREGASERLPTRRRRAHAHLASTMALFDRLGVDVIRKLCEHIEPHDTLCVALSCKALRSGWTTLKTTVPAHEMRKLQWAIAHGYQVDKNTFCAAAAMGSTEVLEFVRQLVPLEHPDLEEAVYRVILSHCDDSGLPSDDRKACVKRAPVTLQYLESVCGYSFESPCEVTRGWLQSAAFHGSDEVLKWLHHKGCWEATWWHAVDDDDEGGWHTTMAQELVAGTDLRPWGEIVPAMRWLRSRGYAWLAGDEEVVSTAAHAQDWESVEWLQAEGCPWAHQVYGGAISTRCTARMERLAWLLDAGCPLRSECYHYAAKAGSIEVLEWLLAHGCRPRGRFGRFALLCAAKRGDIGVLQWLRRAGVPMDSGATATAGRGGQLEALKWLVSHGCPWHVQSGPRGFGQGYLYDLLPRLSLCEHVCEGVMHDYNWHTEESKWETGQGHLEVLKWLVDQGCALDVDRCRNITDRINNDQCSYGTNGSTDASLPISLWLRCKA